MSGLLHTREKLDKARALVELVSMAAGDLEREWAKPLRVGAMEAGDLLSEIATELDRAARTARVD